MMTTLRKIFTCMLTCILMVSLFVTPAQALHCLAKTAIIYVDGVELTNIVAYVDEEGEIRIHNPKDLSFTISGKTISVSASKGIMLKDVLKTIGLAYQQDGFKMYLYTDSSKLPPNMNKCDCTPDITTTITNALEVFVNNIRIEGVMVFEYDGEACIINKSDLYTLFPKETKNTLFPLVMEIVPLKAYADLYGYTYLYTNGKVYLNNNDTSPVEAQTDTNDNLVSTN